MSKKMPPMSVMKPKVKKGTMKRVIKMLMSEYKGRLAVVMVCIILSTIGSTAASLFMNKLVLSTLR